MKQYKLKAAELKVVNNTLKVLCDDSLCYISSPAFRELSNKVFSTECYLAHIKKERQLILATVIHDCFAKFKGGRKDYCNLIADICYNITDKLDCNTTKTLNTE